MVFQTTATAPSTSKAVAVPGAARPTATATASATPWAVPAVYGQTPHQHQPQQHYAFGASLTTATGGSAQSQDDYAGMPDLCSPRTDPESEPDADVPHKKSSPRPSAPAPTSAAALLAGTAAESSQQTKAAREFERYIHYFQSLPNPFSPDGDHTRLKTIGRLCLEHAATPRVPGVPHEQHLHAQLLCAELFAYLHNARVMSQKDALLFVRRLLAAPSDPVGGSHPLARFVDAGKKAFTCTVLEETRKLAKEVVAAAAVDGSRNTTSLQEMIEVLAVEIELRAATPLQRTVFVSRLDPHESEKDLYDLLMSCGHVSKLRVCGHSNHKLSAFVEFREMEGARKLLQANNTLFGRYRLKTEVSTSHIRDNRGAGLDRLHCTKPISSLGKDAPDRRGSADSGGSGRKDRRNSHPSKAARGALPSQT
eukprot:Rhum_TRINITY_DN12653_c0_g1::Rhum_TRINITY_DN12653_c0_g1_i1::g.53451::m.53451